MIHSRLELTERTIAEFMVLDQLVEAIPEGGWALPLLWVEPRDPWTVKDAFAHVTYWKADVARFVRGQRRTPEVRGVHDSNHYVFKTYRLVPSVELIAWHRDVHSDTLAALREAPDSWFDKERASHWPSDLDRHIAAHRKRDIQRALRAAGLVG
jgi:hypothetical protein